MSENELLDKAKACISALDKDERLRRMVDLLLYLNDESKSNTYTIHERLYTTAKELLRD